MCYIRAEEVLPMELIKMIQQYTDGTNLYIPRKEGERTGWGQENHAKVKLRERDQTIYEEYRTGSKVEELAQKYFLSDKSIWRIVRKMKLEGIAQV